ncbi:rod shape-determining protein MreC [Candidatus Dependentiae bacterium]|nr:rod shape-determining protein MreC [Candidatus Dependentiae bacterium]
MKKWLFKCLKIILIIFLFFLISHKIFMFKIGILEQIAATINYPFLYISSKISYPLQVILNKRNSYQELEQKCINLEKENSKFLQENIKLKASLNFAINTQELLDFQKRYEIINAPLCKIIASNFSEHEHYYLINKGKIHGIKKDMIAIYKFQVIGRVTEVYRWHSKILLITDKNSKIAGYTNTTNAQGIVVGQNNPKTYKMEYVNHLSNVQPEDFIISSGQGLIFPEGFCLGKITNFQKTKELYYSIIVEPLVDLQNLNHCLLTNQEKISLY